MANIYNLRVQNFRGIKQLDHTFGRSEFICLVGRGDSGKTTILDAISYALHASWNPQLSDNDFFKGDPSKPLEIEITLTGVSDSLLRDTKYGLHIRGLSADGKTICDEIKDGQEKVLTILFKVDSDLEPKWYVTSKREHQEDVEIKDADRASFNMSLLSDYLDRHFTWSKGSPLSSLLKQDGTNSDNSILLDEIRNLKESIDNTGFPHLDSVIDTVKKSALKFGVNIENARTSIDIKDLAIKDSKVTLHNDSIPLRLAGKGSKRILSIAIQTELAQKGILLVDEIEQGLEPDRVKHLVRTLYRNTDEQMFLTTHSQHVIEELEPENIFVVNNVNGDIEIKQFNQDDGEKFKSLFRSCPEALYANKVIVCEGKTEIGFCRALDKYRVESGHSSMSMAGVVYTLGSGDGFNRKAKNLKINLGKEVCVLCDSDKDAEIQNPTKGELRTSGIDIVECTSGNNLEKQISIDLPWDGIVELCKYVISNKNINQDIETYIKASTGLDWTNSDTTENREVFFKASTYKKDTGGAGGAKKITDKSWFKRIDHGEALGEICFKYKDQIVIGSGLEKMMSGLNSFVTI